MEYRFRPFQSMKDARVQYALWLRATSGLNRPWRSCLLNVEHQLQQAVRFPQCRLYAEACDGSLRGYIGTHPPFQWIGSQHGPPDQSLGWTVPFGFPWTHPRDVSLAEQLYDQMIEVTPKLYADFKRDLYIQRFRESWNEPLEFLVARGWRPLARVPLMGKLVAEWSSPYRLPQPVTRSDLEWIAELSEADPTIDRPWTAGEVQQRFDGGWIVHDTFYRLDSHGAFALEIRGSWAAVTVFFATPHAWDATLAAAADQARRGGASELYFTVQPHESSRMTALTDRGFREVDAGVYYVREAD